MSSICFAGNPLDNLQIEPSHQLHILVSERIADYMHDELKWNYYQSFAGIMAISCVKEYLDSQTGGKWDSGDINANLGGWGLNIVFQQLQIKLDW